MEPSNLNKLETKFFTEILNAELDVPVHATLEYGEVTLCIIAMPEIDAQGYFGLKYSNAPGYEPETQFGEGGVGYKGYSHGEGFGEHPVLRRAWLRRDPVKVQLKPTPLPLQRRVSPMLDAKVQIAEMRHKGRLRLDNNQVTVQQSLLKRAEFCIVDFPDFITLRFPQKTPEIDDLVQDSESLARRLADANIPLKLPPRVVLDTCDGWKITLTKDEEQTRGAVSHTGVIERSDGSEYGTDELAEILECLRHFSAFTAGAWRSPTVVVGYNSENLAVLGEIGRFNWNRQQWPTWFDHDSSSLDGRDLEGVFPRFRCRWKEKGDEITAVIQCYVLSHRMRETGLMGDAVAKSYAGLEMLASLMLGKTISKKPAPKINKVLCENDIPNCHLEGSRHPITTRLCRELEVRNNKGAYLLNEVRNYVTHPLKRETAAKIKRNAFEQLDTDLMQYVYLHDLSQFYLEYLFLRFCYCDFNEHSRLLCEEREARIVGQAAAERTQGQPEIMIQASERSELPVNDKGGREDVGLKEGGPKEWPPKVESSCKLPGAIKSPQGSNAEPPQQSKPSN